MRDSFSVYLHLPYCAKRCPYCDFNTYVVHQIPEDRYVETLLREVGHSATLAEWSGRRVATVFFGGGTPSLFSPASIGRLLGAIDDAWGIEADPEITMEANPGTLEGSAEARLADFRAAGLTRLSFGVQSFHPKHLATLGRIHSGGEAVAAIGAAHRAGFENVSCDLIFGVPGQTLEEWKDDVARAIELGTEHVSAYGLTYEEGTPMTGMKKAGMITAADEDTELAMFRHAREAFGEAGLAQYEISNYSRPGRESRHNLAYWTWGDYLGLGAGAHGFAASGRRGDGTRKDAGDVAGESRFAKDAHTSAASTDDGATDAGAASTDDAATDASSATTADTSWGRRYANIRLPELYMSAGPGRWHASEETLTREMAMAEYLMVRLRLARGIDTAEFEHRFGATIDAAAPSLEGFVQAGLLARRDGAVVLTPHGLELADDVITRLAAA